MSIKRDVQKQGLTVGTVYREWTSECLVQLEEIIAGGLARVRVVEQAPKKPGLDKRLNDVFVTTQTYLKKA